MNDHPDEHQGEPEAGATPDAVAADPTASGQQAGPAAPDGLAGTDEPGVPTPDPWVVFAHDQDVRARAISKRRTKRVLIASGAAVVIIAAAVGGVIASSHSGAPGSGMAPADFVVSSTQSTLAQRTADVTFGGSVSADGKDIPLNGTGQIDFDTNAFTASMTENVASTSIDIRELVAAGQFYMGMSINGQNMSQMTGGAQWVSIALPDQSGSSSLGATNVDPLSQLKALEQKGATVTSLGTSTINGTTVSGYSVTPSQQEIQNDIQQEIQQNQLTPALGQQMLKEAGALGTFTTDVWIDGSGLIRQSSTNIAGGTAGVSGKVTTTFQNYGTPVSVVAPAPSDVIGFQQFLNDLKSAQSSAT
jgi:hypothetical protein